MVEAVRIRCVAGELDAAREVLAELTAHASQMDDSNSELEVLEAQAIVAQHEGDPRRGLLANVRFLDQLRQTGTGGGGRNVVVAAELAVFAGDLGGARAVLDDNEDRTAGASLLATDLSRAFLERAAGNLADAERAADRELDRAVARGNTYDMVRALQLLGVLAHERGAHELAVRLLAGAESGRQRAGIAPFAWGPAELIEGTLQASRLALGDDLYDRPWSEGVRLSLTEVAAYARRGRGERKRPASGWASLTPTEHEVVKLVAEGLSNTDVAERLFVSRRTVTTHLSHVFAKLGVTSRTELAALALKR